MASEAAAAFSAAPFRPIASSAAAAACAPPPDDADVEGSNTPPACSAAPEMSEACCSLGKAETPPRRMPTRRKPARRNSCTSKRNSSAARALGFARLSLDARGSVAVTMLSPNPPSIHTSKSCARRAWRLSALRARSGGKCTVSAKCAASNSSRVRRSTTQQRPETREEGRSSAGSNQAQAKGGYGSLPAHHAASTLVLSAIGMVQARRTAAA
mmetsp:Transcript_54744/g.108671  ORF Transcript_54744/g.108671 Transcript_54744/m.108671 type:complete len:213 (+) Transcript_54744:564-1202(+)